MTSTLAEQADEFAHLADLIRTGLFLADFAIPPINSLLSELAKMGLDNLEIEGPLVYSRAAGCSVAFDDSRVVYAAALVMPLGLGCTLWDADEHASRYGESGQEPPRLKERFVPFDRCPPMVRALLPDHAPGLMIQLLQSFSVLTR